MSSSSRDPTAHKTLRKVVGEPPRRAFTALFGDGGWVVGIAVEDEPGYYKTDYGSFKTEKDAELTADFMNRKLGLDMETAWRIVASSMGAQNARERARRRRRAS